MWQILLLVAVTLVLAKLLSVSLYWSSKGISYEPFPRYLYRVLWLWNTNPMCEVIRSDVAKYGEMYGSYRGFRPSLIVADVEVAKEVLIKQFGNFFKRTFEFTTGDPLWDANITHLEYDQWKAVRTVMGYTFTSAKMRPMIGKLDRVAKRSLEKLMKLARDPKENGAVLLKKHMQGYGMDSMAATAFGLDLNCIDNPDSPFVKNASDLFKPSVSMVVMLLFPSLLQYLPFRDFPPKRTTKFFGELGAHMLAEKKKHLDEVVKNGTADIIDHHLLAQRDDPNSGLTDEVMASQALFFFIAALDTSVVTLEFTTYYLALNPDVQERVYNELASVVGERREIAYDDLQKAKMLQASLLEAMRMMPLSFLVDRICTQDTEVAGVKIEKGMVVEFPSPYMHNDPKYFPEPDKYIPERFIKGGEVSSDTTAFLMFGDGPKNCPGRRLALMNMEVYLANIVLNLKIERTDKTPVPLRLRNGMRFNDFSKDPLYLGLTPRE